MKLPLRQLAERLLNVVPDTSTLRCSQDIYERGEFVVGIAGPRPTILDEWSVVIRQESDARFDWHFVGGRGAFKFLGDHAAKQRLLSAIHRTLPALEWVYRLREEDRGSEFGSGLYVYWPE